MGKSGGGAGRLGRLDDAEDVRFLHDEVFGAIQGNFGAGPLSEENAVASFDDGGDQLARVLAGAFAGGDDFTLGGLFLGGIGDDEPPLGLLFALHAAHQHPVVKRLERGHYRAPSFLMSGPVSTHLR